MIHRSAPRLKQSLALRDRSPGCHRSTLLPGSTRLPRSRAALSPGAPEIINAPGAFAEPSTTRDDTNRARHLHTEDRGAWPVRRSPSHQPPPGSHAATRLAPFPHVTALVDPTLQHKNRAEVLVDGPEIIVRSVATRQA